nr:SGNH/GDSL hydrolase family protein [Sphingomonas glacialis]
MGSSFAAGPGVATPADEPQTRCARSIYNYAHVLARSLDLRLRDVSCSGATTEHILGPWKELPPQIEALAADTRLVTITIGGNDVGFIGNLGSASCRSFPFPPLGTPGGKCPDPRSISETSWSKLAIAVRRIVSVVREKSPAALIVFVDYVQVLPRAGTCPAVPLTAEDANASRATAKRLAALTARVAAETRTKLLKASELSEGHDACSAEPWVTGFPRPDGRGFIPYHPNARGMAAVGEALARHLRH